MYRLLDHAGRRLGLDLRYFAASGFWVTVRYVSLGLLSLATTAAFVRLAPPALYGQYQTAFSVMSLASILSLPGLNIVSLRNVAAGTPQAVVETTRLSIRASWLITLVLLGIGAAYLLLLAQPAIGTALLGASICAPLLYGLNAWYTYYEGRGQFKPVTLRVVAIMGSGALWILLGLWQRWSLPVLFIGYVAITGILTGLAYLQVHRAITEQTPPRFPVTVRTGIGYTLQKFSVGMQDSLQQLLVAWIFGYEALGSLFVGYVLINSATGLMGALSATYFPQLMRRSALPHQRIILQQLAIGIVLTVGYTCFVRLGFMPIFGTEAKLGYTLSLSLASGLLILPLRLYLASYLTAHGSPSLLTTAHLAAYLLAAGLFVLTRTLGPLAAFSLYYYVLQLSLVAFLGIQYWRVVGHVAKNQGA